jgi:hypothetical protein
MGVLTYGHAKLNASCRIKSHKDILEPGAAAGSVSSLPRRAAVGEDALDHVHGSLDGRLQATHSDHGDQGEGLLGVCLSHLVLPATAGIGRMCLRVHHRKTPVLSCKRWFRFILGDSSGKLT